MSSTIGATTGVSGLDLPKLDGVSAVQGMIQNKIGEITDLFSAVQAIIAEISALEPPTRGAEEEDDSWQQKLDEFQKKLNDLNTKLQDAERKLARAETELAKLENTDLPAAERDDAQKLRRAVEAAQKALKRELEQMKERLNADSNSEVQILVLEPKLDDGTGLFGGQSGHALVAAVDGKWVAAIPTTVAAGLPIDYETEAMVQAGLDQGLSQEDAIVAAAEQISAYAVANAPYNPNADELQILFESVAIQTGIDATVLKAISYGEGLGSYYPDNIPRQFFDAELAGGDEWRLTLARRVIGHELPVAFGDDRPFDSPTCGLGIMQLTFNIEEAAAALRGENDGMAMIHGGGRPGYWYEGPNVMVDIDRAIVDPLYNIQMAAELIQYKIDIYASPDRPGGPLEWFPANPETQEEWAIVGSTYQTYGGYGPGGGATERIFNRMTNPEADAWSFTSAGVDFETLGTVAPSVPVPSAYTIPEGFPQPVWNKLTEDQRAKLVEVAPPQSPTAAAPEGELLPTTQAFVAFLSDNPQVETNQHLINEMMGPDHSWALLEERCEDFGITWQPLLNDRKADVKLLLPAAAQGLVETAPSVETGPGSEYLRPGGISETVWKELSEDEKAQIAARMEGLAPPEPTTPDYSALVGLEYDSRGNGEPDEPVTILHDFLVETGYADDTLANDQGFHLRYGPLTVAAVQQFQVENGIEATGKLDEATAAAMADPRPRPAGLAAPLWRVYGEELGLATGEYEFLEYGVAHQDFENGSVMIAPDGQRFIRDHNNVDIVPPISRIGIASSVEEASLHFLTQWGPTEYNDPPSGSDIPFGYSDCGPTAVAMTLSAIGLLEHPDKASAYLTIDAVRDACIGTNTNTSVGTEDYNLTPGIAHYGAQTDILPATIDSVDAALLRGNPVILGGRVWDAWGRAENAREGDNYLNNTDPKEHWVTVLGQTPAGAYIIGDPLVVGGPIEVSREQLETFFEKSDAVNWTHVLEVSVADQ